MKTALYRWRLHVAVAARFVVLEEGDESLEEIAWLRVRGAMERRAADVVLAVMRERVPATVTATVDLWNVG